MTFKELCCLKKSRSCLSRAFLLQKSVPLFENAFGRVSGEGFTEKRLTISHLHVFSNYFGAFMDRKSSKTIIHETQ